MTVQTGRMGDSLPPRGSGRRGAGGEGRTRYPAEGTHTISGRADSPAPGRSPGDRSREGTHTISGRADSTFPGRSPGDRSRAALIPEPPRRFSRGRVRTRSHSPLRTYGRRYFSDSGADSFVLFLARPAGAQASGFTQVGTPMRGSSHPCRNHQITTTAIMGIQSIRTSIPSEPGWWRKDSADSRPGGRANRAAGSSGHPKPCRPGSQRRTTPRVRPIPPAGLRPRPGSHTIPSARHPPYPVRRRARQLERMAA